MKSTVPYLEKCCGFRDDCTAISQIHLTVDLARLMLTEERLSGLALSLTPTDECRWFAMMGKVSLCHETCFIELRPFDYSASRQTEMQFSGILNLDIEKPSYGSLYCTITCVLCKVFTSIVLQVRFALIHLRNIWRRETENTTDRQMIFSSSVWDGNSTTQKTIDFRQCPRKSW